MAPPDVPRVLDAVRPLSYAFAALPMTFEVSLAEGPLMVVSRETLIRRK